MEDYKKRDAATELEIAEEFFFLGIQRFQEVAERYPELEYFVSELLESFCRGEFQLPCSGVVPEFLRGEGRDDDKYVEGYLLGWVPHSIGENTEDDNET